MPAARPRPFADDSFWNQPIAADAPADPDSGRLIALLRRQVRRGAFHCNLDYWTIPVYEVDETTPLRRVWQRHIRPGESYLDKPFRMSPGFGMDVPIPDEAVPSREADAHLALIDRRRGLVWDMWGVMRREDSEWESFTGMRYALDGSGVFDPAQFPICDGETIHAYGPSRAPGVPAIAGLIMRDEVVAGEIPHRIAAASQSVAFQRFVPPAVWTDGCVNGGIPEGAVLQLDPGYDASGLSRGAQVVVRAMQRYGLVMVDYCRGASIYGEGLWGRGGWDGVLEAGDLHGIGFDHFRILRLDGVVDRGDSVPPGGVPSAQGNV